MKRTAGSKIREVLGHRPTNNVTNGSTGGREASFLWLLDYSARPRSTEALSGLDEIERRRQP